MRKSGTVSGPQRFSAVLQAGLILMALGSREALAAAIEIDGNIVAGTPTWVVNGMKALGVKVNPGDTITWKAQTGTHGVVFPTQAEAEAFLTFQTGGGLPALAPIVVQGQSVWGNSPQPQGTLLAQTTVKATVAPGTILTFFCSQHGPNMNGSLTAGGAVTPPPPTKLPPTTSTDNSPRNPGGLDDPRIKRVVRAEVVALDQAFLCNRLGAAMPQGMIFALKRDVVSSQNPQEMPSAGCVTLRPGKRARPIVLRANVGDCLEITFTNLLCPIPRFFTPPVEQPVTREAGVHVAGLELVGAINSDASYVGLNLNSLTPRGRAVRAGRVENLPLLRPQGGDLPAHQHRGRHRRRRGRRPAHRGTLRLGDRRAGRSGVVPQPGYAEGLGARVRAE